MANAAQLRMVAQVVDQFSGPPSKLRASLASVGAAASDDSVRTVAAGWL